MTSKATVRRLSEWYENNKRDLPWRSTRDPYKIWISETMLQQTTSRAVIPYYNRFLTSFPSVKHLAKANEGLVLENWAGLGYYSRARNLHKAAKIICLKKQFPREVSELLKLPGLGPYTARAVASIAFEVPVGVVDGNTIRVMSRWTAWKGEWWKTKGREKVQNHVDSWVQCGQPSVVNQALMELGASVCSAKNPSCLLCPIKKQCHVFSKNLNAEKFPLKKIKKATEIWVWKPEVSTRNGKVALIKNSTLPFLKDQWILPGAGKRAEKKPTRFDYSHSITHHRIYVQVKNIKTPKKGTPLQWIPIKELSQWSPVTLVKKAIDRQQSPGV